MIEITAQFDDDQAELLESLVGKVVLIDHATVEAMYLGRVVLKMHIAPAEDFNVILSSALKMLPILIEDSKVALEWEKLTGSRNPYEYLSTRAANEWPVKGDEKQ
jgi:ABC-type nitrate/sulfonate/bicarbonate transport system ATPase subunit